jgi:Asp-tRNA(Asn)/Glu-tRNA(Gln) amidotransferase A subunit family amidase
LNNSADSIHSEQLELTRADRLDCRHPTAEFTHSNLHMKRYHATDSFHMHNPWIQSGYLQTILQTSNMYLVSPYSYFARFAFLISIDIIKDSPKIATNTSPLGNRSSEPRIGILHELAPHDLPSHTINTWKEALVHAAMMNCSLHSISIPLLRHAVQAYYLIACSEVASNLARFSTKNLAEEARRRILLGNMILSTDDYTKADSVRRSIQDAFHQADVDFWILPVAADIAPLIKDVEHMSPIENYISDIFTIPGSLAGLPCVVIPFKTIEGMPIGIQLMGRADNDEALLDFAEQFANYFKNNFLSPI